MGSGGDEVGVLAEKKVSLVFPGQGSQGVGMGKELTESYPAAADIFAQADSVLGYSLSDLCFNGPEDELKQTINTQPALYVTSAAAHAALQSQITNHKSPIACAGHSVGEYAALFAAGAFSFETGLKLVRTRAELMQKAAEANPGAMAAILGLSPEQVSEAVGKASDAGTVVAANFNSPIQTVISGDAAGVARASEIASEMGAKRVVPLNVSGGFHSPLMQVAADGLAKTLASTEITDLSVPVVANFTADAETTAAQVRENLARQITGSVKWVDSVRKMVEMGTEVFLELGSGNVLAGLIKRIAPEAEVYSVRDKGSLEALLSA